MRLQQKSKERVSQGLFVVEGVKEVQMALEGGYKPEELFLCRKIFTAESLIKSSVKVTEINPRIFKKLAYRKTTGGVIALCRSQRLGLESLHVSAHPILLILDRIEKPGNLGAILRTAEAAGVEAVILSDPKTDRFNPNVIRSSVGTVFTTTVITGTAEEIVAWLKKKNIQILAMALDQDIKNFYETALDKAIAIVIGTEDRGLSPLWLKAADETIQILMRGKADSLNLSNATAIVTFEALRQRLYASPSVKKNYLPPY